jgi:hypothetical protein
MMMVATIHFSACYFSVLISIMVSFYLFPATHRTHLYISLHATSPARMAARTKVQGPRRSRFRKAGALALKELLGRDSAILCVFCPCLLREREYKRGRAGQDRTGQGGLAFEGTMFLSRGVCIFWRQKDTECALYNKVERERGRPNKPGGRDLLSSDGRV